MPATVEATSPAASAIAAAVPLTLFVDTSAAERFFDRLYAATNPADSAPMREGLHGAVVAYRHAMGERFESASGGDGTWKPLAPYTIRKRIAAGETPPLQILRITGSLYRSVADPSSPFATEIYSDRGVVAGAADFKARWQHSGTGRIPARPIIVPPNEETQQEMKRPVAQALQTIVRATARQR